jgi:Domain of unknown function (DUF1707)
MSSQRNDSRGSDPRTGQYRTRGFSPLFRGLYSDQHLRVSDAERQAVADRLAEHFADGRLDQAEFDDRVGRAMNAKTRADLSGLFSDLPETGAPAVPENPRRRHGHPVLLFVLLVIAVAVTAHALWWTAVPMLWLGVLVVGVLLATRSFGRSRPSQDR